MHSTVLVAAHARTKLEGTSLSKVLPTPWALENHRFLVSDVIPYYFPSPQISKNEWSLA